MSQTQIFEHPPYEALQREIDQENWDWDALLQIDSVAFPVSGALKNKLKHPLNTKIFQAQQIKNYIKQKPKEISDFENFWAPTLTESQLLEFYLDVIATPQKLEQINLSCDQLLTPKRLKKALGCGDDVECEIYYLKQGHDVLPDDRLCIAFSGTDQQDLENMKDKINARVDYQCNCIIHQNCLEIYGILKHIIKRLADL